MTKRRSRHFSLLICVTCLLLGALALLPASAAAQDGPPPTAEELERAEAHFAKGAQYFSEQRYASAIVEFLSAYKYKPDPMLQYNISVAHARLGNIEEAYDAAKKASASDAMPDNAVPVNTARVHAWGSTLRARALSEAIDATSAAAPRAAREEGEDDEIPPIAKPAEPASFALSALGWSGVAASAVGVGLLGYATYVDLSMADDIDAYKSAADARTPHAFLAYKKDLSDRQIVGLVSLYSGVALTAAGLGLLSYDIFSGGTERASIDVSAGGGSAAVRLTYLFD